MGRFPRSLAGLLLLLGACLFLLSDATDALISQEGRRSPELSGQSSPQAAAEQQHSKEERPAEEVARWPLSPRPVQVTLYGEARCPFCADWLVKNSQKLVSELGEIVDFRVVEFGNARRNESTGALVCQHGPSECEANALFACAREAFESGSSKKGGDDSPPYRWLNVVVCSERDVFEHASDPRDAFDACVVAEVKRGGSPFADERREGIPGSSSSDDDDEKVGRAVVARLRACASGDEGARLVAEAERETGNLIPKHTFVPWVVVDGLPLGDASLETTRSVACAAWRGKREDRPAACLAAPGLGGGGQEQQQQSRSIF